LCGVSYRDSAGGIRFIFNDRPHLNRRHHWECQESTFFDETGNAVSLMQGFSIHDVLGIRLTPQVARVRENVKVLHGKDRDGLAFRHKVGRPRARRSTVEQVRGCYTESVHLFQGELFEFLAKIFTKP